jgi:hypothetical protein
MEGVPNWKLNSENQHTFNGISEKKRLSEDVYRQKSYFHFRFNTNSGGFFPMQCIFYLKPQGHQIWAYNYHKICMFLLTFSILQYLIGFIFLPTMYVSIFCLCTTFPYVLFDWYQCLVVIHL